RDRLRWLWAATSRAQPFADVEPASTPRGSNDGSCREPGPLELGPAGAPPDAVRLVGPLANLLSARLRLPAPTHVPTPDAHDVGRLDADGVAVGLHVDAAGLKRADRLNLEHVAAAIEAAERVHGGVAQRPLEALCQVDPVRAVERPADVAEQRSSHV